MSTWLVVGLVMFLIWEESVIKDLIKMCFKCILSVLVILTNPVLFIMSLVGLLIIFH